MNVIWAWRSSAASRGGECSVSGAASTSVPPASSGMNMSMTDTSKVKDAKPSTRLPGPTFHRVLIAWARLTRLRCSTTTPLGWPVDPEV